VTADEADVHAADVALDPEAGRNIVAPSGASPTAGVRAMTIANPAPSAPVMNHLRPLITQPSPSGFAAVWSISGSDPAPGAGSVIAKQDRCSPRASGAR
jgi:hypothetical protein